MNSSKLTLVYSTVLLFLLLLILWIADYAGLGVPERFPGTNIQPYTVIMFAAMVILLILFQKKLTRIQAEITLTKLVISGVLICILSQAVYQLIRQWLVLKNLDNNKAEDYLRTMAVITILSIFLSLAVATELKKANAFVKTGSLIAVGVLIYLTKEYIPNVTW